LTGAVAQLSRGLLPEVSKRLTAQFADCLRETVLAEHGPAAAASPPAVAPQPAVAPRPAVAPQPATEPGDATTSASAAAPPGPQPPTTARPAAAQPIGGIRLGLAALWSAIVSAVRRLFARR
jgi:hypothetical protein